MNKKCDRQELATKGLDLLLWKTIRVKNFEQEEKKFYFEVSDRVDTYLEGYDLSDENEHLIDHYINCLLSIQFAHWDTEPAPYSYWRNRFDSGLSLDNYEFSREDSDYNMAFPMILMWAKSRLIDLDVGIVYDGFLKVVQHIKHNHVEIPESVHLDFVTSSFLLRQEFACLELLNWMTYDPLFYIALPKHKSTGQGNVTTSVLLRLVLLEEFNQLAKTIFHVSLFFKWIVIERDGDVLPMSQHMMLFKYKFQNPPAQRVLCDVINEVKVLTPFLDIVDKLFDASINETPVTHEELDEIVYTTLHFCFNDYKLNLFLDENGTPYRKDKIVNMCTSYYVKIFDDIGDKLKLEGVPLFRKAKFVQEVNSKNDESNDMETEKLPTICSFLERHLSEFSGLNIPAKTLWRTYSEIEKNEIKDDIKAQWHEANLNRKTFKEEWFETQVQVNFLPKYQRQPQKEPEPLAPKPQVPLAEQVLKDVFR